MLLPPIVVTAIAGVDLFWVSLLRGCIDVVKWKPIKSHTPSSKSEEEVAVCVLFRKGDQKKKIKKEGEREVGGLGTNGCV